MKAIQRALAGATQAISAVSDTPRLDAELLMAEALGIDRDRLLLAPPNRPVPERFEQLVERRAAGEPVAYITGRRAFWDIELHVGPGVLIPRPDSEVLIAAAIEHFGIEGPKRILDLGTGPGTLLLAALDIWPLATGIGVDSSRVALSYAAANARRLGLDGRAHLRVAAELRIARHAFVFLEQLRRIAALPVVLAVAARLSADVLAPLPPAAAPAAALTIADQISTSFNRSLPLAEAVRPRANPRVRGLTLSFRTAP